MSWKFGANIAMFQKLILSFWMDPPPHTGYRFCPIIETEATRVKDHIQGVRTNYKAPRLTLRRLMSYIYMEHPFLMFLDHTQRRSTVGRTPLDE